MKGRLKSIVSSPEVMGTILHSIALKQFGAEIYSWEAETIIAEFEEEFGAPIHEDAEDRLLSIVAAIDGGAFYMDPKVFAGTCEILSGDAPDLGDYTLGTASVGEISWGVLEMALNDPTDNPFDTDVAAYVRACLDREGIGEPPAILSFAGGSGGSGPNFAAAQEFTENQARVLFEQVKALPWSDENLLRDLGRYLRDGDLRIDRGVATYAVDFVEG